MAITKPYTFQSGTKARASEVNQDFDILYSEVNRIGTEVLNLDLDIQNVADNKADINGNPTQVFKMANPMDSYDGVNKDFLENAISNTKDYIGGFIITKDTNDTIIVSAGSCYDSTYSTVIISTGNITKQNTAQLANGTYYVYIISDNSGRQVDALIATESVTPPRPTGYSLFRQIGYYTTNSDNVINNIVYYGEEANRDKSNSGILNVVAPDWANKVSKTVNTEYVAESNGWIVAEGSASGGNPTMRVYINNVEQVIIGYHGGGGSSYTIPMICPVAKGDTYKVNWANKGMWFVPVKGA